MSILRATFAAALLLAPPLSAQPAEPPPPPPPRQLTLDDVSAAQRLLIKQRAMHCYLMPDGTIWDGTNYFEHRKILDYTFKPFDRVERGEGATIVEDRVVGTIWKIKSTREARAWGFLDYLAGEGGEVETDRFEQADRRKWTDAPPLWTCASAADYSWPFAYIDESDPDAYARLRGGYLEITRDWGEGRYDFKGYSLDHGHLEGIIHVTEPVKWIKKDRFKGAFFLWPTFQDEARGPAGGQNYELVPVEQARFSADHLAAALLDGRAQIVDWRFEMVKEKVLWRRSIRTIECAAPAIAREPADKPLKPPPAMPQGGPDLLILKDGRYFRGAIVRRDGEAVIIKTLVGQSEMEMTFKPEEVKEIQAPEKR